MGGAPARRAESALVTLIISWFAAAALLTSMVSTSHDLPWGKALGASTIQLVALLILFKLAVI